jgi:hypothetical protein
LYTSNEPAEDKAFVAKKLSLSDAEFDDLITQGPRHCSEFPNNEADFETALNTLHNYRRVRDKAKYFDHSLVKTVVRRHIKILRAVRLGIGR